MPRTTCSPVAATLLALAALSAACTKDPPVTDERPSCNYHTDCANNGACYQGRCNPTASCIERSNCRTVPVCADDKCICERESQRCYPVCESDNDCATEALCLDGLCTKMPVEFNGMPFPSSTRGNLKVGVARVDLDFPMGVSMAGFASRQGPRTPYQDTLGGSNAWFERIDVRALAFDDGKEMFVLLRIPLGWSTDELHAMTAYKVQERTGMNLIDRIITSAPHSHSLPARFWHLIVGYGFGYFGYDEFGWEIFDRLTTSFADAVIMAIDAMQPAKFGFVELPDPDPQDQIWRDRRGENNGLPDHGKDRRMVVMRVDDANGDPIAVLTHFGMHGTVFDYNNPIVTGDAPGAVENELTLRASEKYGRPVLGFYIQGNAGDLSPGGDGLGHRPLEVMQVVGKRAWAVINPALDTISTRSDVQVGVLSRRVSLTHSALGYQPGEFYDSDVMCEVGADYFRYGAFQCVEGGADDEDPSTRFSDGDLNCVFSVECLTDGFPVPQFEKTHLAVARIGELAMATMPGEPLSQFGRNVSDRVEEAMPGVSAAITLGYSMDHHFYLLNTDDWLQGGYEPSRDIWGWRLGPYLTDRSVEIATELNKEPEDRLFDQGNLKPMVWNDKEDIKTTVPFTNTEGDPTEVLIEVSERVERLQIIDFSWRGGHPGLDQPVISLEREENGSFVQVVRAGGLPYVDGGFETLVHYDGNCSRSNCDRHAWRVTWEESRSFAIGKYRFRANGRAFVNNTIVEYSAISRAFDLVPSSGLEIYDLRPNGQKIEARIIDPRAVKFETRADGSRVANEEVGHRLRSEETPNWLGAPLPEGTTLIASGTIRKVGQADLPMPGASIMLEKVVEARQRIVGFDPMGVPDIDHAGPRPTTKLVIDAPVLDTSGDFLVMLRLEDQLGNFGTVTATITVP